MQQPARITRWFRLVMTILLACLALFASVLVLAWFRQDSLIYFPDLYGLEDLVRSARAASLAPWPAAEDYRGLMSQPPAGEGRGTVIVFHGNAGSARDRTYFRDALLPLGFRVLLAEYPGYGPRKGPLGEKSLTGDARETFRLVRERFPGPVYLWGESLGCAVATAAARDLPRDVAGLALVTPWADLPHLAGIVYPFLPVRLLVRDRFDNLANLAACHAPVAVIVAGRDEIIPSSHTRSLFMSIRSPKRLWTFPRAGHNSWLNAPGEAWWSEVGVFLASGGQRLA